MNVVRAVAVCSLVLAVSLPAAAGGVTVNHTNWSTSSLPQTTMDKVNQLKVFFAHASVGGNMVNGLYDLRTNTPSRFKLRTVTEDGTPPATTASGNVYEYMRGNPGWASKISLFETYLAGGWGSGKVDVAINKFCYVDQTASFTQYRDSMVSLEALYPQTRLVYMTIPLLATEDLANRQRNDFNTQLRQFCLANNKLLLDIADLEAWNTSGVQQTFTYGGATYQKAATEYLSDWSSGGGHLNVAGRDRVSEGLYSLLATGVVPEPASMTLLAVGVGGLLLRRKRRQG